MKLLFDENLSDRLVTSLAAEFPGSAHVKPLGLSQREDRIIWQYAAANGCCIATKDDDFAALSAQLGAPPKVLLIKLGNKPTRAVHQTLLAHREHIEAFILDPTAAMMVIS